MCTHVKKIYNSYIQDFVYVDCGHCPECLQKKADQRANRIRNSIPDGYITLFVTLTYKNQYLPVIRRSDIDVNKDIEVLRYCSPFAKDKGRNYIGLGKLHIDTLPYLFDAKYLRRPKNYHYGDFISIPYFRDIQNFFKRLRINLSRDENVPYSALKFKYYATTELGPTTHRGHAHLLLHIKKEFEQVFRNHVVKAWPFADSNLTARNIKVARHAAHYVASYVNCDASIPKFFSLHGVKAKHSYSQNYGLASHSFTPFEILEQINRGTLTVNRPSGLQGTGLSTVLLPKYVVNRHFPLFKGFSRIPICALSDFLQRAECVTEITYQSSYYGGKWKKIVVNRKPNPFDNGQYTDEEIHKIVVSLENHAKRFCDSVNAETKRRNLVLPVFTRSDFFVLYEKAWRVYASQRNKLFYLTAESNLINWPYVANYDNLNEVYEDVYDEKIGKITVNNIRCDTSLFTREICDKYKVPNSLPSRLVSCAKAEGRYYRMVKRRKVVNSVMSILGHDV